MSGLFLALILSVTHSSDIATSGIHSRHVISDPLANYRSVDYSKTTEPMKINARITDLMNGEHFDDILRDTPDNMRPPSIILFYNTTTPECMHEYSNTKFENTIINKLPSRAFLFAAEYNINAAPYRTWYNFIPERDLAKRFNVNTQQCLTLVWVPRQCNGFTEWCINEVKDEIEYLGCDDFVEQCKGFESYNENGILDNNWIKWVNNKIESETSQMKIGGPNPNTKFKSITEQEKWISGRDGVTTGTELRNAYAASVLPAFTKLGYKALKIPDSIMREFIIFYNRYKDQRRDENWESWGQTQVNGHEVSPYLIYMDLDSNFRDQIGHRFIRPVLEEYFGIELELTSHYGLREYHSGSWLRNHIDRIDVLVLSVTLSLFHIKGNETGNNLDMNTIDTWPEDINWGLEAVDFEGNNVRYNHKPGTMMLYESAKLIHGRPYPLPKNHDGTDLIHIGSFCHFTPKDGSWKRNGHPTNAQRNIQRFRKYQSPQNKPSFKPPKNFKPEL